SNRPHRGSDRCCRANVPPCSAARSSRDATTSLLTANRRTRSSRPEPSEPSPPDPMPLHRLRHAVRGRAAGCRTSSSAVQAPVAGAGKGCSSRRCAARREAWGRASAARFCAGLLDRFSAGDDDAPAAMEDNVMTKGITLGAVALLGLLAVAARPAAQGSPVGQFNRVTAFVNVNAVPMDANRVLSDWTVVVGDGKVVSMGPSASTEPPQGATIIDGRGKYLMPGLAEMHGHIPPPASSPAELVESVMFLYV